MPKPKHESKIISIQKIINGLPNVYAVFTFNEQKFVPEEAHRFIFDEVKKIAKIVGVRF